MLRVTFFDVGHGDSILIENTVTSQVAVVDCSLNLSRKEEAQGFPKVYKYLKNANAKAVDTVVVTHLHRDHLTGIETILRDFEVGRLIVPPFLSRNDRIHNQILDKTVAKLRAAMAVTDEPYVVRPSMSLAYLLAFVTKNESIVEEAVGPANVRDICGFDAVIHLPLPRIKGRLHHVLSSNDADLDTFSEINDASIALSLTYAGQRLLLSGDSTLPQWQEHKRQRARDKVHSVNTSILKVSHHGSHHNNTEDLYRYLLDKGVEGPISIVSANGRSHPHAEYFKLVSDFKLRPYCTGLAEQCKPQNVQRLCSLGRLPVEARLFLDALDCEGPSVSCQGDITVLISDDGESHVTTSQALPCVYRL